MIFPDLGLDFKNTFQNDLPELPREPPGSPPGGPRGPQEAPRARPQEPARGPQEPPTCGLRAAWAAIWGTPGAQKPPGGLPDAILVPSGFDFVPFGNRFSRPPKTRPGGSRELRGTHVGTILNLCWTLQEPIAASLGPAALPNFGRTWQRRRRNIKRLRVAQGQPRGLQGALGDSCWDNVDPMFEPSGAHRGFIWGLHGLR